MGLVPVIIAYWLFLACVVFIAGGFVSRTFVTLPSGADACLTEGGKRCFGELSSKYIFIVVLFSFFFNIVHLLLHISYMTETPLRDVFSVVWTFLSKTRYGKISLLRTVLLTTLIPLTYMSIKRPTKGYIYGCAALSICILFTFSMTSHQAQMGILRMPFITDFIHIISISSWIGGILFIRFCYGFFLRGGGEQFTDVFIGMIKRYSTLATYAVVFVLLSGVILVLIRVKGLSFLVETAYGRVLVLKALVASVVVIFGGVNKFFIVPKIETMGRADWATLTKAKGSLQVLVTFEAILGLAVLFLTAILSHLSPEG